MGRRSRKRIASPTPAATPSRPSAPRRRARTGEAPKPVWAPFPLSELTILFGILAIGGGVLWGGPQGRTLLACGVVLVSVAALELAVREHVAGYRSHSALLALVPTAVVLGVAFGVLDLAGGPGVRRFVGLGVAAAAFIISFLALREVFRRRSGGLSFRA